MNAQFEAHQRQQRALQPGQAMITMDRYYDYLCRDKDTSKNDFFYSRQVIAALLADERSVRSPSEAAARTAAGSGDDHDGPLLRLSVPRQGHQQERFLLFATGDRRAAG